jgi:probable HAF family extracellular repeat protein
MTTYNLLSRLLTAGTAFLMASSFAALTQAQTNIASRYEFVKLDYPNAPASYPLGINSSRQIVGARIDLKGVFHGYLYANGTFTDIDYPGASQIPGGGTITGGINDLGAIAGTFSDAKGFQHGFLRTVPLGCANSQDSRCKPIYQQLDVPGAAQTTGIVFETGPGLGTAASGINLEGNVVGMYATQGLYSAGFEYANGKYISIDDPASAHVPGLGSRVFEVNDFGVMVGSYESQATPASRPISNGFVYFGYQYIPVFVDGSDKGGFGTQANGINDLGEVVGVFTDQKGVFHGFLWALGQAFSLDFPNVPYTEAHGINIRGDITGAYLPDMSEHSYHGFVAYRKN